jgi:hypothetical protein
MSLGRLIAFLTGFRNRFTAVSTWLVAFSSGVRRERAFLTREIAARPPRSRAGLSRPQPGAVVPATTVTGCRPSTRDLRER